MLLIYYYLISAGTKEKKAKIIILYKTLIFLKGIYFQICSCSSIVVILIIQSKHIHSLVKESCLKQLKFYLMIMIL